ncbi:uncharacterized protein I206_105913 [Kwoniella pini CBS 10737]|uniref:NmrA-like domain-containing protein n=1 Tax=Kwoniella pini CBS 10737 TaxID=1296096 RepID=A0AAJ8L853_9TREE
MSTIAQNIIVFGATGQQGASFIEALSTQNTLENVKYAIYALSRNPSSNQSTKLSNLPGVKVISVNKDYMNKPELAFEATGLKIDEIYGIFNVQGYVSDKVELAQGKAIIDASKKWNVKQFVYSSVSFGGLDDTKASGMEVKRDIENYLFESNLGYTILRPTQFMDNLLPNSAFIKHQLISIKDIGKTASQVIINSNKWLNKIIELAGDNLTIQEIENIYKEELNEPIELTYWPLATFVRWVSPLGPMAKFFDNYGFKVNINQLKKDLPEVEFEDFRTYLRRYKASQ